MDNKTLDTIKRVIREVTAAPPPNIEQPMLQRQAPARQYSRTVQGVQGRLGSGAGAIRGGVEVSRSAPFSGPSGRLGSGAGAMQSTPKVSSGGVNTTEYMSKNMSSMMKDKLDTVSRNMSKGFVPSSSASLAGKAAGGVLKALSGPAAGAAMAVMDPTPAGEKKSEFQRQADVAKGISFEPKGRSMSQIEKDMTKATEPKKATLPDIKVGGGKTPTPPSSRPEYFTRDQAFKAARSEVGSGAGKFSYGGKEYQTNVAGEKYKPAAKLKTTSVVDTESGKYRK